MIHACKKSDLEAILAVINAAAESYRAFIPANQWKEPYMHEQELVREIAAGIKFSGFEQEGVLKGITGVQKIQAVPLIRHAYVDPSIQRCGIGSALLSHCRTSINGSILIGTWADATWAINFYEKHGFCKTSQSNTVRLLHNNWTVPETQIEASVVMANSEWFEKNKS